MTPKREPFDPSNPTFEEVIRPIPTPRRKPPRPQKRPLSCPNCGDPGWHCSQALDEFPVEVWACPECGHKKASNVSKARGKRSRMIETSRKARPGWCQKVRTLSKADKKRVIEDYDAGVLLGVIYKRYHIDSKKLLDLRDEMDIPTRPAHRIQGKTKG